MREWVSVNGKLCPAEQATISVFDSGFMQGIGLFTTMRAYAGRVFRLNQHIERMRNSAVALGWALVPDAEALRGAAEQVVAATEQAEARVRLTVTTGTLRAGIDEAPGLTIVANASPLTSYPQDYYRKGVTLTVARERQSGLDATAGHKTTSYFPRLASLRAAHARGAFDAIWLTLEAHVAECSICSIFAVDDGVLVTPPLSTPVLPGIARAVVLEAAAATRTPVREQAFSLDDLLKSDEAFVTNSLIEIVPVVRVEREPIGNEKVGDVTRALFEAYGQIVERECARA